MSSPISFEDLARATVRHLALGDFDAFYGDTVATFDDVKDVCPEGADEWLRWTAREHYEEVFLRCRTRFRFSTASFVRAELLGERTEHIPEECGADVTLADAIVITVTDGDEHYTFEIDDPIRFRRGWLIIDTLHCSDGG